MNQRRILRADAALRALEYNRHDSNRAYARFQAGIANLDDHRLLMGEFTERLWPDFGASMIVVRLLRLKDIPGADDAGGAASLIRQVLSYTPQEALPAQLWDRLNQVDSVWAGPPDQPARLEAALVQLMLGHDHGLKRRKNLWDQQQAEILAANGLVDPQVWLIRVLLPEWTPYQQLCQQLLQNGGMCAAEAAQRILLLPFTALADLITEGMWDNWAQTGQNQPKAATEPPPPRAPTGTQQAPPT